ncbi:MAG TPA: PAS domain S-box protein, partial [Gemmatimonadales bacterium]|nr:PAS domain S-box protein [Gemmatimonadales bacterium]
LLLTALLFALVDLVAWRLEQTRRAAAQRERALGESETRYRHVLEQASDGIVVAAPDGGILLANQRFCEMLGYSEAELLRLPAAAVYAPGELEREPMAWAELERTSVVLRERRLCRKDGSTFLAELSVRRTADGYGQAIVRDITERRRAEEALRAEHALLESILATSVAGIMVVTAEGRLIFLNPAAELALGLSREQLAGQVDLPAGWRLLALDGSPLPKEQRPSQLVVATGQPLLEARLLVEQPDGDRRILSVNAAPLRDGARGISSVVMSLADITEQECTRLAVVEREEQLERITSAMPGVVYQYVVGPDAECRFAFLSERVQAFFGVSAGEIMADPSRWWAMIDPEDQLAVTRAFRFPGEPFQPRSLDFRVHGADGQLRWLRDVATAVPAHNPERIVWHGVMVDITERRRLEEELLQASKMESLGRLAGGVAHDFNNLLTVIRGYADVLSGELSEEDPRAGEVREIRRAADRATSLTRQLLAMSRRQVMVPREVDLNLLVQEMDRMLRRVIGVDIRIVTDAAPELGWVRADAGQLEQVLLNLAVNARDAMPDGGILTIRTGRVQLDLEPDEPGTRGVPPGDYVVLQVTDTGIGMDRETQRMIFEPFFTTKPVGEGTGLGLSTVYGIVQQSHGVITVESAPGAGSSFRIFLPRVAQPEGAVREAPAARPAACPARRQTVLLVEDDDGVRQLAERILCQYGYEVVVAEDGEDALRRIAEGTAIDAVVSDVVMPGIGGVELVERLRAVQGELPVLLLSGYTGDEVSATLAGNGRQAFLQKPFSPDALAAALDDLLADVRPPATAG